jgi:rod shape-determining protein MreD
MIWIRRLRLALLILAGVVLQTTLFSEGLRLFGVTADIGLVMTIAVAYYGGPELGAAYGFLAGLAIDSFLETPFGLSALSYSLVGYGVGAIQTGLVRSIRWIAPILGGLGALVGGAIFILVGGLVGQEQLIALRSLKVLAIASVYDATLAIVAFPIARWATRLPGVPVRGYRGA